MDVNTTGRILFLVGVALVALGGLFMLMGRLPLLKDFGHLPGDIRIARGNFSCFFPVVSMIILSVLLSLALNLILRVINR